MGFGIRNVYTSGLLAERHMANDDYTRCELENNRQKLTALALHSRKNQAISLQGGKALPQHNDFMYLSKRSKYNGEDFTT